MDIELERRINETIDQLQQLSTQQFSFNLMDPVAKMMLVALINEAQKIRDHIDSLPQRIADRFCTHFIPRQQVEAMPAIALVCPTFKPYKDSASITIGSNASFTFKSKDIRLPLNFIPLFNTTALPHTHILTLTHANQLFVGIETNTEVHSLASLSLLLRGTQGILPKHITVGQQGRELDFATMNEMEAITMAEPFDAQQASGTLFSLLGQWKQHLLALDDTALLYITDNTTDRDLFKPHNHPKELSLLTTELPQNHRWLQFSFDEDYIVPHNVEVVLNVMPVVNVNINTLTLTQAQPIAKLQKIEDSAFLQILETSSTSQKQGFNTLADEVIVRDFDAACYNNADLYRDVRNLYNRFIDDYYAFIEYNAIKDGEVLKQLRQTINRLGKSVGRDNQKFKFDSGTYVMKNMNQYPPSSATRVSYITTMGQKGNAPQPGDQMENKSLPMIEQKVHVLVGAMGGADKANADQRYELLRYYALTADRLYTKMDIDAFLRKELIAIFGRQEYQRIFIKLTIEGADAHNNTQHKAQDLPLQRGLYIDLEFKDLKNYEHAIQLALDKQLRQKIENNACIAMPIIITLKNLETTSDNNA